MIKSYQLSNLESTAVWSSFGLGTISEDSVLSRVEGRVQVARDSKGGRKGGNQKRQCSSLWGLESGFVMLGEGEIGKEAKS
jgi:hypothetical protein